MPRTPAANADGTDASDASMPATDGAKDHGGHHHHYHAGPLNRFRKGSADLSELIADRIKAPAVAAGAALRKGLGIKPHDQVPACLCGLETIHGDLPP